MALSLSIFYLVAHKLIVASDLPAIRELINDGENGLLFIAGDTKALAAQLQRLLSDSDLRQRISEGVSRWFIQKSTDYDIGQVVKKYQLLWQ